ncbi:MAG TPA: hypothetical protein PKA41_06055 [Verrucomicrobiota bacterium]|nr:hypothetical protein [Verrucomicrobiota bacterium]
MNHLSARSLVASLVLCVSAMLALPASGADTPPAAQATATSSSDLAIVNGSLSWTGPKRKDGKTQLSATVQNAVELLQELYPDANFIVSPGIGHVHLSDFKLRGANAEQSLQAICIASGNSVSWRDDNGSGAGRASGFGGGFEQVLAGRGHVRLVDPGTGLALPGQPQPQPSTSKPATKPMYVLDKNPNAAWSNAGSELQVQAFSLSGYFESQLKSVQGKDQADAIQSEIKSIERMIDETIQVYKHLQQDGGRIRRESDYGFSIRFHKNANLLVVMGDAETVGVAAKVVSALPGVKYSGSSGPGGGFDSLFGERPARNPFTTFGASPAPTPAR